VLVGTTVAVVVFVIVAGAELGIVALVVLVVESRQFPNHPYVEQVSVYVCVAEVLVGVDTVSVVVWSRHPHQPGVWHVVVAVVVVVVVVLVEWV